jgi:hypothetical protein
MQPTDVPKVLRPVTPQHPADYSFERRADSPPRASNLAFDALGARHFNGRSKIGRLIGDSVAGVS